MSENVCPSCGHKSYLLNRNGESDLFLLADAFFKNLELVNRAYHPGGWGLDDKRPFGNSNVYEDILFIIGIPYEAIGKFSSDDREEAERYALSLYEELGEFLNKQWSEHRKYHK